MLNRRTQSTPHLGLLLWREPERYLSGESAHHAAPLPVDRAPGAYFMAPAHGNGPWVGKVPFTDLSFNGS